MTKHAEQFTKKLPELGFMQIDEGYTPEGDLLGVIPPTGCSAKSADMRYETGVTDADDKHYHDAFNWGSDPGTRTLHLKRLLLSDSIESATPRSSMPLPMSVKEILVLF